MATVQDYPSLVQALMDTTHRDNLRPYADLLIQGAAEMIQNDIFTDNFGNGIRYQEEVYGPFTLDTNGNSPVPSDWLSPKFVTITVGSTLNTLIFKSAAWMYDRYPDRQAAGIPAYIARDGNVFIYGPAPDDAYTVQGSYYASAVSLSQANPTNWMTQNFATGLLAAVMSEAAKFLVDDSMLARWYPVYQQKLKALVDADKSERWASTTLQIELG